VHLSDASRLLTTLVPKALVQTGNVASKAGLLKSRILVCEVEDNATRTLLHRWNWKVPRLR